MSAADPGFHHFILGRINIGIVVVDREHRIVLWNRFMEIHTGRKADEVEGEVLFDRFPELPRTWLEKKLEAVFLLGNYAFTNWQERPFLFRMPHNRPVTRGVRNRDAGLGVGCH